MGVVVVPFLLVSTLIFVTLLGAALIYSKSVWVKMIAASIVLSPLVWLTWDSAAGYVHFKRACKADAGFKVYAKDLPPAVRVRLVDNVDYPDTLFNEYSSIKQVEARIEYGTPGYHIRPTVYALYERGQNGKLFSKLMAKIVDMHGQMTLIESAPSTADYFIEKEEKILADLLIRKNYTLRDRNHRIVAETISYKHFIPNPSNSIFFTSFTCGPVGTGDYELKTLLQLVTYPLDSTSRK